MYVTNIKTILNFKISGGREIPAPSPPLYETLISIHDEVGCFYNLTHLPLVEVAQVFCSIYTGDSIQH